MPGVRLAGRGTLPRSVAWPWQGPPRCRRLRRKALASRENRWVDYPKQEPPPVASPERTGRGSVQRDSIRSAPPRRFWCQRHVLAGGALRIESLTLAVLFEHRLSAIGKFEPFREKVRQE